MSAKTGSLGECTQHDILIGAGYFSEILAPEV
jgi:hypothetical protein